MTAQRTGPHHGELGKTGLCSGRNRPAVGVIRHQILNESEASIETLEEIVGAVQRVEDDFNAQRHQRPDERRQ